MSILLEALAALVIFFVMNYAAYWLTEVKGLPSWLQYKPWVCRLCLSFWSMMGIFITLYLALDLMYVAIYGILLTVLNTIALWIDQKDRTVKIEDFDKILNE